MALKIFGKTMILSVMTVMLLCLINFIAGLTFSSNNFLTQLVTAIMLVWRLVWRLGTISAIVAIVIGLMSKKRKLTQAGSLFVLYIFCAFILSVFLGHWWYYVKLGAIKNSSSIPVAEIQKNILSDMPNTNNSGEFIHYTDLDLELPNWVKKLKSNSIWYYNTSGNKAVQIFYGNRIIGTFSYIVKTDETDIKNIYPYSNVFYCKLSDNLYLTTFDLKEPFWLFKTPN